MSWLLGRTQNQDQGQNRNPDQTNIIRAVSMRGPGARSAVLQNGATHSSSKWSFMLRKSPRHVQRAQPKTFTGFCESVAKVLFCAKSSCSSSQALAA